MYATNRILLEESDQWDSEGIGAIAGVASRS